MNSNELLQCYRTLWKNRELAAIEENAAIVLKEAIRRELRDENAHPRVRKNKQEKLIVSLRRINESTLSADKKLALIDTYFKVFDEID